MTKMAQKKLYIIGIDSAPLWIISHLYKKYKMRGFEHFINEGTLTDLESTMPPVTAAAWPSIYSGEHPKGHGVIDFLYIDKNYTRQLIYYEPEGHKPFWEELSERGKRSLVVTPPMVLQKTKSKNVDLITGWPLEPRYGSKELEAAADKFGFKGEPDIGVDLDKKTLPLDKARMLYDQSIKARSEMSKYLIKKKDYDLVFVCFTETDRIQHYALNKPNWEKYVAPLYASISSFVEWVIDYSKSKNEDSMVLLVSDHGAQPVKNKFLLNTWLIDNGYAAIRQDKMNVRKRGRMQNAKRYISERIMKLKIRRVVYNVMPSFMKTTVEKMIDESLEEGQDNEHLKIQETDFDMGKTRAFAAVSYGPVGMIWINDSRFSKPTVKHDYKEKLKSEIIAKLSRLKTEEGDRLVIEILDGSKYYKGSKSFIPPDILIELKKETIIDFSYYSTSGIFMKPEIYRSGDHTRNGIFGTTKHIRKSVSLYELKDLIVNYFK